MKIKLKFSIKENIDSLPYLKKLAILGNISVWEVDGEYVRDSINIEFTNMGQHYYYKFIPENEFWIDKEENKDETQFFIDNLKTQYKLMKNGMSYDKAKEIADKVEKKERKNSTAFEHKQANNTIQIHKKLLKKEGNIEIWLINGKKVRDNFFIDFTEGGHGYVYKFIPLNEIWIDDDLLPDEVKYVIFHEKIERELMKKGMKYDEAHKIASSKEFSLRQR